jgi:hypothetical protein
MKEKKDEIGEILAADENATVVEGQPEAWLLTGDAVKVAHDALPDAKKQHEVLDVPDDFSYLDPDRPDITYEKDMTPEERERFAPQIAATKARAAKSSVQPPFGINLPDGRRITREDGDK